MKRSSDNSLRSLLSSTAVITASILILLAGGCKDEVVETPDVSEVVDSLSSRLDWVEYRLAEESFQQAAGLRADSLEFFSDLYVWMLAKPGVEFLEGEVSGSDDEERRLTYLKDRVAWAVVENAPGVKPHRDSLQEFFQDASYEWDGQSVDRASLHQLLYSLNNSASRERIYRQLHAYPPQTVTVAANLVRARRDIARTFGFNSYPEFRFRHKVLSFDDYERILAELEEGTRDHYEAILQRSTPSPGSGTLEIWDLLAVQDAAVRRLNDLLPSDSLEDKLYVSFRDMGFDILDLPVYFRELEDGLPAEPSGFYEVAPPFDVRLLSRNLGGFAALRTRLANVGGALYGIHIRRDEPLFGRIPVSPVLSASQQFFGSVPNLATWYDAYMQEIEPAERRAIVEALADLAVIELRLSLTAQQFELLAYRSTGGDLSRLYWDAAARYLSVSRHDDLAPWVAESYVVETPLSTLNDILGMVIAAQTREYLLENNQTIVGNPDTRAFLVENYFRHGRRYNWKDLVERGLGTRLDPRPLLADLTE